MLTRATRYFELMRKRSDRPLLPQLAEMVALRLGPGKLGVSEYLAFGLGARSDLSLEEKKEFIGWRIEGTLNNAANAHEWRVLTHDKLAFHTFAEGAELPVPKLHAVFHPMGRTLPGARALRGAQDVRDYLAGPGACPFFGKPVHGGFGRGVIAATGYDPGASALTLMGEKVIELDAAVAQITEHARFGYLIQEPLAAARNIANLTDGQLSTLRVVVMLADGKPPWLLHADWKVPRRGNPISNFARGRFGNFVGLVDTDTGRIDVAYTGPPEELTLLDAHPLNGTPLAGQQIVDWPKVRDLVLRAAPLFPGVRLQYWDVALTDRGPVLLELNSTGEVQHTQFWPKPRKGFMSAANRRYIDTWSRGVPKY